MKEAPNKVVKAISETVNLMEDFKTLALLLEEEELLLLEELEEALSELLLSELEEEPLEAALKALEQEEPEVALFKEAEPPKEQSELLPPFFL